MDFINNPWIILLLPSLVAALAGFLLARVQGQQQLQRLQQEHQQDKDHWQQQHNALRHELTKEQLQALHWQQSLEQSQAQAMARQQELQQQLNQLNGQWQSSQASLSAEQQQARATESLLSSCQAQLTQAQQKEQQLQQRLEQVQQQNQQLSLQQSELSARMQEREQQLQQQQELLQASRQALSQEFENLAQKIFSEKGKNFVSSNKESLESLLVPLREQLQGFQRRINEVHDSSLRSQTDLNAEIKKVLDIGLKMSTEATNLSQALKGDSQQRGAWGEAQLRRTLEMSGLVEDTHYEVQSAFRDQEGKQKQTDYLVKLPDNKQIIIDSKVSLLAYDRAVSADSPEQYQLAMNEHLRAVRKHIDDLAAKDYTNLIGMHSPSFVLMFMPIEPAYIEALKHNKDLFDYGYKKGIVLVSHTTLIPILRTVSNLWMLERSNAEAREISDRAGDIFNNVCLLAERLQKLGNALSSVGNHYNSSIKALTGQQGLYGKVERFGQLSSKVSKELPQVEPLFQDLDSQRLQMIVEPVLEHDAEPVTQPVTTPIDEPWKG